MKFGTKLLHGENSVSKDNGAVTIPIFQSSTFHQFDIDNFGEYDYARSGNPTRNALEKDFAKLEGAEYLVFTAGVGENSDVLRRMVADRFAFMGVKLDEEKNSTRGYKGIISADDSSIKVVVLPTDEEVMIARDTFNLI